MFIYLFVYLSDIIYLPISFWFQDFKILKKTLAVTWIQPETSPNMIPVHSHDATLPDQTSQLHLRGLHGLHIWHHLQRANGHSPNHLLASAQLYGIPAPLLAVAWGIGEWAFTPSAERHTLTYYTTQVMHSCGSEPTPHNWHPPNTIQYLCPEGLHLITCYYMLCGRSKPRRGVNLRRSFSVVRAVGGSGRNQICVKQDKVPKRTTSVAFLSAFPWQSSLPCGSWRKNVQSGLG